jgi:hypothetical protein
MLQVLIPSHHQGKLITTHVVFIVMLADDRDVMDVAEPLGFCR